MAAGRFFFLFQAEDGIRGYKVTGVQTCALPISSAMSYSTLTKWRSRRSFLRQPIYRAVHSSSGASPITGEWFFLGSAKATSGTTRADSSNRSEERRVGKE